MILIFDCATVDKTSRALITTESNSEYMVLQSILPNLFIIWDISS